MSIDTRINRLMPVLSAKERGILVLRSLKDKTPENVEWRRSMPPAQTPEFNRYICLMNACNIHLPMYITMVEQHTEQLWLRVHWLHTIIQAGALSGTSASSSPLVSMTPRRK